MIIRDIPRYFSFLISKEEKSLDTWRAFFRLISESGEKSTGKLNNPLDPRSRNGSNTESTEIPTTTHCPPTLSNPLHLSDQSPATSAREPVDPDD